MLVEAAVHIPVAYHHGERGASRIAHVDSREYLYPVFFAAWRSESPAGTA